MKLILASNSPRRKELLSQLNYKFDVIPANLDEYTNFTNPCDMVCDISCRKAIAVYKANMDAVVIGCDTVVDLDGKALGKPKDVNEACAMLKALSGRTHKVHTGVCIMSQYAVHLFADTSLVTFDDLTDEQISKYVASGSPMDKAGAYGIQDSGFVSDIEGSYNNVMGFPSDKIDEILKNLL
ncbi:MAG: Maf family protein [Clostridia bacterium]|nr:Maf family protein [Clostridia bacterium]